MKIRFITITLALLSFLVLFGGNENTIIQPKILPAPVAVKDDGITLSYRNPVQQNNGYTVTEQPPYFTIPGLNTFVDYVTNGNTLNQLVVIPGSSPSGSNDTVIAAINYCDSTEATNSNAGTSLRMRYNYSFDGGTTWQKPVQGVDLTVNRKSRFPDMYAAMINGLRVPIALGRIWDINPSTNSFGGVTYDSSLGAGNPVTSLISGIPHPGRDFFGSTTPDGKIIGIIQASDGVITYSPDTLRCMVFIPATNSFLFRSILWVADLTSQVCSYTMRACSVPGSNLLVAAFNYINEPFSGGNLYRSCRVAVSTNNGFNWTVKEYGYTTPFVIAGDSCQPYWHENIVFKPGTTNYYVVYPTWPQTQPGYQEPTNNKGWKICIQSPALNGEKPVVIADYHNIQVLGDTSKFNRLDYTRIHSFTAYLGHPSLGFSEDGSVMWCAFEVIQTDTCPGPPVYNSSFFYHDIYVTKSLDGGNTWAVPWNVTNTQFYDELYPVLSPDHNKNSYPYLLFQADKIPGSHTFIGNQNLQQTVDKVYTAFLKNQIGGITKQPGELPEKFSLYQNYPNPFNPKTNINVQLSMFNNVKLIVYDILGKEVTTLINQRLSPGSYEVTWDGTNYPSGVYFYKLSAGDFVQSKKMILLK